MYSVKVGDTYGAWTVIGPIYNIRGRNVNGLRAVCECACGVKKDIYMRNVLRGKSLSCGCAAAAATTERMTVHGEASPKHLTPEYVVWKGMLQRCGRNPREKSIKSYRDRNITVCARWRKFDNFLQDMGRRPSPEHQLDRIDNDVGYTPENVRWVTRTEQMRNKRNNVLVSYNGQTRCIAEWSEITGIPYRTLLMRIQRSHWTPEKALTTPIGAK